MLLMNLCRFVVLCNSIVHTYNATGLKINDQVLKAYIYSCMFYESFIYTYVVINYHGWHLNGINGPLMCSSLYLSKSPMVGLAKARPNYDGGSSQFTLKNFRLQKALTTFIGVW